MNQFKFLLVILLIIDGSCNIYQKSSKVTSVSQLNFKNNIQKVFEEDQEVVIHHYFFDNNDQTFADEMSQFANDYNKMFKQYYTNCNDQAKLCEQQKIKENTVRIYQQIPFPHIDFTKTDIVWKKVLAKAAGKLKYKVNQLSEDNLESFINSKQAVPKAIFFIEKENIPLIIKGLSVFFRNSIDIGVIQKNEKTLIDQYKENQQAPRIFDGEFKYNTIQEFINFYSQTFVPEGNEKQETKKWLVESVPELHYKSAQDICTGQKHICVVYCKKGSAEKDDIKEIKTLKSIFQTKMDRGAQFKLMWINLEQEKFFEQIDSNLDNKIIVIKKNKYNIYQDEINQENIQNYVEKIQSGDLRYQRFDNNIEFNTLRQDI